jgi:hypothetical protein
VFDWVCLKKNKKKNIEDNQQSNHDYPYVVYLRLERRVMIKKRYLIIQKHYQKRMMQKHERMMVGVTVIEPIRV